MMNNNIHYLSHIIMLFIIIILIFYYFYIKKKNSINFNLIEGYTNKKTVKKKILDLNDSSKISFKNIKSELNNFCKNEKDFNDIREKILNNMPDIKKLYLYGITNNIINLDVSSNKYDQHTTNLINTGQLYKSLELFEEELEDLDFNCVDGKYEEIKAKHHGWHCAIL